MKKLNNKGFSLVELIIVIAIMAILVGVVGTQVIPYLENSRKAKDIQILSGWNTAGMSAYSAAAAKVNANASYTIKISDGKVETTSKNPANADGISEINRNFCELTGLSPTAGYKFSADMESKAGQCISYVEVEIAADGTIQTKTTMNTGATGYKATYTFDTIEN